MKITRTTKQETQAGQSFSTDLVGNAVQTVTYATDKKGLPFSIKITLTFPDDMTMQDVEVNARAFIQELESDSNQTELDVNKGTGEVKEPVT